ncbi:MAG: alpha/beta hydrolase [Burkholderiaceae bacterium]
MARIELPYTWLEYSETGHGEPLVLSPGLAGRSAFWSNQLAALASRYRVITYDHRGCGASDPAPAPVSVATMAQDLLALLDALGLERASVIGHSTGGAICQHLAVHAPERLDRIVLSCSWTARDAYMRSLFHVRKRVLESCGLDDYGTIGSLFLYPPRHLHEHPELLEPKAHPDPEAFIQTMSRRIDAILAFDCRADLGRIRVPTLVIGAVDDTLTPAYFSRELAERIPDARLVLLPYGGHYCPVVQPARYNAALLDFLQGPAPAPQKLTVIPT